MKNNSMSSLCLLKCKWCLSAPNMAFPRSGDCHANATMKAKGPNLNIPLWHLLKIRKSCISNSNFGVPFHFFLFYFFFSRKCQCRANNKCKKNRGRILSLPKAFSSSLHWSACIALFRRRRKYAESVMKWKFNAPSHRIVCSVPYSKGSSCKLQQKRQHIATLFVISPISVGKADKLQLRNTVAMSAYQYLNKKKGPADFNTECNRLNNCVLRAVLVTTVFVPLSLSFFDLV